MLNSDLQKKCACILFDSTLPLVPEVSSKKTDENKTSYIVMELKVQAGGPATSGKYKKNLALFDEGSPQQWIDTQRDILEVWTQNSITTPVGRMAVIKTVLRGESLTAFETSVVDNSIDEDGVEIVLTMEILTKAMTEVTKTIFGHRALENQKQWMRKYWKNLMICQLD